MTGAMRTALAGGMAALGVWALASAGQIVALCQPHRAWTRGQSSGSSMVLDRGERVIRPGDATWVCETAHTTGPFVWHEDLSCYCAPASMPLSQVERAVGGSCTLDRLHPSVSDGAGRCRFARCGHYVDPE